eukprot:3036217-Rhodomonas_salina.5
MCRNIPTNVSLPPPFPSALFCVVTKGHRRVCTARLLADARGHCAVVGLREPDAEPGALDRLQRLARVECDLPRELYAPCPKTGDIQSCAMTQTTWWRGVEVWLGGLE